MGQAPIIQGNHKLPLLRYLLSPYAKRRWACLEAEVMSLMTHLYMCSENFSGVLMMLSSIVYSSTTWIGSKRFTAFELRCCCIILRCLRKSSPYRSKETTLPQPILEIEVEMWVMKGREIGSWSSVHLTVENETGSIRIDRASLVQEFSCNLQVIEDNQGPSKEMEVNNTT